ncbi:hypothetical protein J8I82_29670 [Cupriavidus sp. LEh25]|nr:hypothetical protein [Cupriavidus sp. LEh25]
MVGNGRLVRCEPFAADPDPSPLLNSVVPMVYSPTRIPTQIVQRGWLGKREASDGHARGCDDFFTVPCIGTSDLTPVQSVIGVRAAPL